MQAYSDPKRESNPTALPDLEVWEHTPEDHHKNDRHPCPHSGEEGKCAGPGFYYWSCFPGCLPDSEPIGPFPSEAEALADARQGLEVEDEE